MTWRSRLIAIGFGLLLSLAIMEAVLRIAMPHWRDFHSGHFMTMTAVPGHGAVVIGRPGFDGYFAQNNGDFRVRIAINAFGLRNPDSVDGAQGRFWAIGDSMTFGWGVELEETYSAVAERISGMPAYNIASPGTDICGYEALVARMPKNLAPKAVTVGLVLENDVNDYDCVAKARAQEREIAGGRGAADAGLLGLKKFLTENLALYNFFAVSLKRVDLLNRLLLAVGLASRPHAQTHEINASAIDGMSASTAEELKKLKGMLTLETPFAVLIIPSRFEIRDNDEVSRRLRLAVVAALAARSIDTIDVSAALTKAGFTDTHFTHDGHWTPLGHRIAGEALAAWQRSVVSRTP